MLDVLSGQEHWCVFLCQWPAADDDIGAAPVIPEVRHAAANTPVPTPAENVVAVRVRCRDIDPGPVNFLVLVRSAMFVLAVRLVGVETREAERHAVVGGAVHAQVLRHERKAHETAAVVVPRPHHAHFLTATVVDWPMVRVVLPRSPLDARPFALIVA